MTATLLSGTETGFVERLLGCDSEAYGLKSRIEAYGPWIRAAWGFEAYSLLLVNLFNSLKPLTRDQYASHVDCSGLNFIGG